MTVRRVLIVSAGDPSGLAHSLATGFRDLGSDAVVMREPHPRGRVLSVLALRGGISLPTRLLHSPFDPRAVERLQPSLVIFVKTPFVPPDQIRRVACLAPTVCWNPDSPFDSAPSNSMGWVQKAIGAFDAYVTWSTSIARSLGDLRDRVYRLPFAWEPALAQGAPVDAGLSDRIAFVGTATPERVAAIRRLAPLRPVVYGNGWDGLGVDARPAVYGRDLAAVALGARWSLNLLRPQNRDSHNMRTFELLGLGANQLTYRTADHEEFLVGSRHTLVDSVEELAEVAATVPACRGALVPSIPPPTYADRCQELVQLLVKDSLL